MQFPRGSHSSLHTAIATSEETGALLQKYQSQTFRNTRLVRFRDRVSSIYLERTPVKKQDVYRKTSIYQWHLRFVVAKQLMRIPENKIAIELLIIFLKIYGISRYTWNYILDERRF